MRSVVAGSTAPRLARNLAVELGAPCLTAESRSFPDGEHYVRVEGPLQGSEAVVVQSTPGNDAFAELLLLLDACREAGAKKVIAAVPYLGYARQDRAFKDGEPVSVRAVLRAIAANADSLISVDVHKPAALSHISAHTHVSAVPMIAKELATWRCDLVLAPDAGAKERAANAAGLLGVPYDHLEKKRLGPTEVKLSPKEVDVKGKRVVIIDDMIASGMTMVQAAQELKRQGAKQVFAACTHGVFTGNAVPKLLGSGIDRLLCTDTLERQGCDIVGVAPLLAKELASAP